MPVDQSYIDALVRAPQESLAVEVKTWIDPRTPEGAVKLVKTCIALRNNGGGFFVIGFNNAGQPDEQTRPADLAARFHIDVVQGLVTKHSAEPFAIEVRWGNLQGAIYPVIEVPEGVKYPVATKSPVLSSDGKVLVPENRVYVRSLQSNNTPATTEATYKDWPRVVDVCFENREADFGRFFRRHLATVSPETLRELFSVQQSEEKKTPSEVALAFLTESGVRFRDRLKTETPDLPEIGFLEVAFAIDGPIQKFKVNTDFLNLIMSANPKYTGWPMFLDSRASPNEAMRPSVEAGVWEALIVSFDSGFGDEVDLWRADPSGRFYHGRGLQDDLSVSLGGPKPLTTFDFGLPLLRVAEAIALGLEFAKAMGAPSEETLVGYAFRWTHLKGRDLSSWAQRDRFWPPGYKAHQDEVVSEIVVPLVTPKTAIAEYVHAVTEPLFDAFSEKIDLRMVGSFVEKLLSWGRRR